MCPNCDSFDIADDRGIVCHGHSPTDYCDDVSFLHVNYQWTRSFFPLLWSGSIEYEKRLGVLKTKIKRLLRQTNPGPQLMENLADELAQNDWSWTRRRRKGKKSVGVISSDLLQAVDILREAASAGTGVENRLKQRELIDKLKIRLSPREEERFLAGWVKFSSLLYREHSVL